MLLTMTQAVLRTQSDDKYASNEEKNVSSASHDKGLCRRRQKTEGGIRFNLYDLPFL